MVAFGIRPAQNLACSSSWLRHGTAGPDRTRHVGIRPMRRRIPADARNCGIRQTSEHQSNLRAAHDPLRMQGLSRLRTLLRARAGKAFRRPHGGANDGRITPPPLLRPTCFMLSPTAAEPCVPASCVMATQ
ncbi:hypothetical protein PMIN03_006843 [Paraphaeosphaeria minitans]